MRNVRRPVTMRWTLISSLGLASLIACSHAGDGAGVITNLDDSPDWHCITNVVKNIGSVKVLQERNDSTGRRLTLRGLAPAGTVNTLIYTLEGISYALQVTAEPGLPVRYTHYSIFPRATASADALARSLGAVIDVAGRVEG